MPNKFFITALLGLLSHILSAQNSHDYSNRVSLTDPMTIATWDTDTEGFTTLDPRVRMKTLDSVEGWSTTVYEGNGCLEVTYPKGEPANRWRTIKRRYPSGLNLEGRTLIEYGINSCEGPGRDFITRLVLTGPKGQHFEATAHIIPTLWRSVFFYVGECQFLDNIRAIEIGLCNEGALPWNNPRFCIDGLRAGHPLDLDFSLKGSSRAFQTIGKGHLNDEDGIMTYEFDRGGALELRCDTSHNMMYNPPLEKRNTVRMVITNNSTADSIRLYFATSANKDFKKKQSKTAALPTKGEKSVIQINLSDIDDATGHLRGMCLEPLNGHGAIDIDRISFEHEQPIRINAGSVTSATATVSNITVKGTVERQWLDSGAVAIELRHAPLYKTELPADSLELLDYCPYSTEFILKSAPNSRLDGRMTHLSSRLATFLRLSDGRLIPIGEPFFIENWRDFTINPYAFKISGHELNVKDYGATGDGHTNDNAAIQQAIDDASEEGGGCVILPSGGEYIATDIMMRPNVELRIEPGAVLRQSGRLSDYTSYTPEYGHDNIIPGIPWTHCMYTNLPLILAKDVENVRITGGGTIRMDDTYSENPAWTHYAHNCSDRLHLVPIAVCNTRHVEITDIDIIRANNYHTIFYRADSVFIGNLKMLEVACFSGDGISLGNAVTNVCVDRCVFESNDDGIVLAASYKDPRGGGWRVRVDTIDSSIRNIEVRRSYIDSNRGGGGKAIAFIPWASTNPRLDHNEIDGIEVHDCVLRGGHSIGTWPDNPFDGKQFTNTEVDDYSPIKNVNITGNEYLSLCDLMWVKPTSFVSDSGLHGSSAIKNGDFADRTAYWTTSGDIDARDPGAVTLERGAKISQGLWLEPGEYEITYTSDTTMTLLPSKNFKVETEGNYTISLTAPAQTRLTSVRLSKL